MGFKILFRELQESLSAAVEAEQLTLVALQPCTPALALGKARKDLPPGCRAALHRQSLEVYVCGEDFSQPQSAPAYDSNERVSGAGDSLERVDRSACSVEATTNNVAEIHGIRSPSVQEAVVDREELEDDGYLTARALRELGFESRRAGGPDSVEESSSGTEMTWWSCASDEGMSRSGPAAPQHSTPVAANGNGARPGHGNDISALSSPPKASAAEVGRLKAVLDLPTSTEEELVRALESLKAMGAIPTKVLGETLVGRSINQLAKTSTITSVRDSARMLVEEWRQMHSKRKS